MKVHSLMGGLAAAALLCASPALAAIEATEVGSKLKTEEPPPYGLDARIGLGSVGGNPGKSLGTGPLLGLSAGAQIHPDVGIEAGYEGQRFPIDSALVGSGEGIWRHNLGVNAKVGPLLARHFRPFLGVGAGLTYFDPSKGAEAVFRNDLAVDAPLSAGLDYNLGKVFAGARATYDLLFGEGYADKLPGGGGGNILNGSLMVGGRF